MSTQAFKPRSVLLKMGMVGIGHLVLASTLFLFIFSAAGIAEENEEIIVLKVRPKIIALPGNEVARVPISAARVRSDELRALNERYNVIRIERLYEYKNEDEENVEKGESLVSAGAFPATIDLSRVFTREIRKEMQKGDIEVEQVKDTFLLQFAGDVNMTEVVTDYLALEVVVDALAVKRVKEEEKN